MDLESTEATSSRINSRHQQQQPEEDTESRTLRSSTRSQTAKQNVSAKGKGKERETAANNELESSTSAPTADSRKTRSAKGRKGKGKEVQEEETSSAKRPRRNAASEPSSSSKPKKRTSDSDEHAEPANKRPKTTSSYALRSAAARQTMAPRKSNSRNKAALKSKIAAASSSRLEDEDVEMLDANNQMQEDSDEELATNNMAEDKPDQENTAAKSGTNDDHEDDSHDSDGLDEDGPRNAASMGLPASLAAAGFGLDEAMAIFGDYRQFGSYMVSLSSRLKTMLANIKTTADPTTRLLTLQELSELLSISTEDTLAGSFPVDSFVRELVKILGGKGADEDEGEDDDDEVEHDEDAALAAALAMSGGAQFQGDENPEAQVLACRCLANLMEALPGVAHTVVYHGAIPVLCSKLIEISYIDLAEQTLLTLEKISEEFPSAIVREGGLSALLNYLDFFSIAVQRTALQAAANCCRSVSSEHFAMIKDVWPIIRNCLSYTDQRLVEFTCMCVIRVIDSYHRASVSNLESLADTALIRAVNHLLLPAGGSPIIAPNTFTLLLRALATCARASPKITLALLEADIVDTLYQILTGVLPSAGRDELEQGGAEGGQGLGGGLADMTVMENLAHRPKDQVEEALSLISELLPPLPKDGVFDHRAYSEKSLVRMVKSKAKAERAAARQAAAISTSSNTPEPVIAMVVDSEPVTAAPSAEATPQESEAASGPQQEPVQTRTEILRSNPAVVDRFMQVLIPILVDVYAASVATPVRVKTLNGLLKAVSFLDADGIQVVLKFVPIATFASSIMSSRDHPSLVIGALQLVDLLLCKAPALYRPAFRREGVFHEIESLSDRKLISSRAKEKEKEKSKGTETPTDSAAAASLANLRKLGSTPSDPEDAITLRARVIKFTHMSDENAGADEDSFERLRALVERFSAATASEEELVEVLWELAQLFASPHTTISSFELLQSGIVDGLLRFATDEGRLVGIKRRKELLLDAFTGKKSKTLSQTQNPFATLVKKLQESLTRMESFEVITVSQNSEDSKRSSPSLLAKQLRLRLVADSTDADIPRSLNNIVVSIHAIATFQALHDYLRPRVAGLLGGRSHLSGMFAALAAAGYPGPLPSSSRAAASATTDGASSTNAAAGSSSSTAAAGAESSSTITRRRSQRLVAKNSTAAGEETEAAPPASGSAETAPPPPTSAATEEPPHSALHSALSDLLDPDFNDDFSDDDVDAEVYDEDEVDPDNSVADKTITLNVAEDGSKVEAQTPDGTRVATPSGSSKDVSSPANLRSAASRGSYAAALKSKPTDWHLQFSMDDQVLPLDLTIYGAIHQHEMRKKTGAAPLHTIWQNVYTIKFKKVTGPAPAADSQTETSELGQKRSPSPSLSSLPETAAPAKILRLLRVLSQLNTLESERTGGTDKRSLADSAFVNNKLSAKLTRQLEEPMIVASSCLPDWAVDLPQNFPFLFPFATRYNFLQCTSFGYARLILKWQNQQSRGGQDSSRRDEGIGFLGRLQRQKVRISRKHILESAVKVFELYGSSSSVLEIEYFEEVGTGLGPTLEFYSLVSKEFARKDLKLWRDADPGSESPYVLHPTGLYPAPISREDVINDGGKKRTHVLRIIGQFVAKAMLDSRIIDLSFNKLFLSLVLGQEVPVTIASLKLVDPGLAKSLAQLQTIAATSSEVPVDKLQRKIAEIEKVKIEDLALDFTVPGYDIELRPGGRDIPVTSANVHDYIDEVLDAILGKGVQIQAKAFREGFSKVFPVDDLRAFTSDELVMLFGNTDEDWSIETLTENIKADHGFNVDSRSIRYLLEIMSEFDGPTRRAYLQFITGSPKLPIGGFKGLNPPLTVVRKPHEAPLTADDYLPSVMTCVNYLKLPEYSSKDVMKEKLRVAVEEGVGSFHLS